MAWWLVVLLGVACAEAGSTQQRGDAEVDDQSDASVVDVAPDVPVDVGPEVVEVVEVEIEDSVEVEPDVPPVSLLDICVVNGENPNGACAAEGIINLVDVPLHAPVHRFVRLRYMEGDFSLLDASVADDHFTVRVLTFSPDEVEEELPLWVETAHMAVIELTFTATGRLLETDHLLISVGLEEQPSVVVPIVTIPGWTCPPGMGDCTGDGVCESDLRDSLEHCGACGAGCSFSRMVTTCDRGLCEVIECAPGWMDRDGDISNGCEYQCQPTSDTDIPDAQFRDENCDGIDGDVARAIFVAPDGDDLDLGTMEHPLQTIGAAIARAQLNEDKDHVYVSMGVYPEAVVLVDGVSIFGGFDRARKWQRAATYVATIAPTQTVDGRIIGVRGVDITSPTYVRGLTISPADGQGASATSYGLYCQRCPGLKLHNNVIVGSAGGPGVQGTAGDVGRAGAAGGNGGNGQPDGDTRGAAGTAGGSTWGRAGGAGGRGGAKGDNQGERGVDGQIGTPGGAGGAGGNPGSRGVDGSKGADGAIGEGGQGGSADGTLVNGFWVGNAGATGARGAHGNGGGGGGGGGGQGCLFCINGTGNGGGGGGAGGEGGAGGTGGSAGGGSFGVFLLDSTGVEMVENVIRSGQGGNGGGAGAGGEGGNGGGRGLGATHKTDEIGAGGDGGVGGKGGRGGAGGGGAGGNSFGVFLSGTDLYVWTNDIQAGSGGNGGNSPSGGNSIGARGRTGPTN